MRSTDHGRLWAALALLVLTASSAAEFPYTDNPITGANFWIGRWTALKAIANYLLLAFWPAAGRDRDHCARS